MEFLKLVRLAIKLVERFFVWNIIDTGVDVVPEDTDKDERADESRMEDRPEDDTGNDSADNRQSIGVGNPSWGIRGNLSDFPAEGSEGLWETVHNKIRNTKERAADDKERNNAHTKDAAEVLC